MVFELTTNFNYDALTLSPQIDGCATFWRRSRFDLEDHASIEYNVIGELNSMCS